MDTMCFDRQPGSERLFYSREKLLSLEPMARPFGIVHPIPADLKRRRRGCRSGAQVKAKKAARALRLKYLESGLTEQEDGRAGWSCEDGQDMDSLIVAHIRALMWTHLDSPQ